MEAMMNQKHPSGSKPDDTRPKQAAPGQKEPNLGQKEAGVQQDKDQDLKHMGEKSKQ